VKKFLNWSIIGEDTNKSKVARFNGLLCTFCAINVFRADCLRYSDMNLFVCAAHCQDHLRDQVRG